jgi:penicillin-binding protein 2
MPSISAEQWRALTEDPRKPLMNKATAGVFAPGSTFKPVVALAALENRAVTEYTPLMCVGHVDVGRARFHCWHTTGHGPLEMRKAIEQSCNAYFCQLGMISGHEVIVQMARGLRFGEKTGIELGGESSGFLPDAAWKQRRYRDAWRPGDTCNLSIGQGALTATPLQMAVVAAALANGGTVYRPRLIYRAGEAGEVVRRMNWSADSLRVVRGGMRDVVQADTGTGKRALVPGMDVAGKTGTAEYGPRSNRRKYVWMIAFAPYASPRYAIAIVIEDGDSGGLTAAPLVGRLLRGLQDLEPVPGLPGGVQEG